MCRFGLRSAGSQAFILKTSINPKQQEAQCDESEEQNSSWSLWLSLNVLWVAVTHKTHSLVFENCQTELSQNVSSGLDDIHCCEQINRTQCCHCWSAGELQAQP